MLEPTVLFCDRFVTRSAFSLSRLSFGGEGRRKRRFDITYKGWLVKGAFFGRGWGATPGAGVASDLSAAWLACGERLDFVYSSS